MYFLFDTETSNFPNNSLAVTDRKQARIVQLAWLLLDESFREVGCFCSLIKVGGKFDISDGAAKVHGKTPEMCDKLGVNIEDALAAFRTAYGNAEFRIAHNLGFDRQLIDIEERVLFGSSFYDWSDPSHKCTMLATTPICQLPGKIPGKWKWPKLQEAYAHVTGGKQFDGAHDALADVRATAVVFRWLLENGHKL